MHSDQQRDTDGHPPEDRGPALPIMRRAHTLERAGKAMTTKALGALGPAERVTVTEWQEGNCLRNGTSRRKDRVRELVEWAPAGGLATPQTRMDTEMLGALSFAKLPAHLAAWLDVYARQKWERWPDVLRFAVATNLEPQAVSDAAARILWRTADVSQDARARQLGVQASAYREATRRAEVVLRAWLNSATRRLAHALEEGETD